MKRAAIVLLIGSIALLGACGEENNEDNGGSGGAPLTCAEVDRTEEGVELMTDEPEITLSGVIRVVGRQIYDSAEVVTIEPGTIFLMEPDSRIYFGWRNDAATVFANGTAERPILFCGTEAGAGHWNDIEILGGTSTDSYFEHVRIEDGGGADADTVWYQTMPIRLSNVAVIGNEDTGMELYELGGGSENLTIEGSGGAAVLLGSESAVNNFPAGSYTGNGEDVALVYGITDTNVVFNDRGIPYRQMDDRVNFGSAGGSPTSFTLNEGVTYQFCQDCFMNIGWRGDPGTISIRGTAENPVIVTSARETPMPGDWDGINLLSGTKSDSTIEHAEIRYGGKTGGSGLIVQGGKGNIRESLFADSAGAGVLVKGDREPGLTIDLSNTFENNAEGDLVDAP